MIRVKDLYKGVNSGTKVWVTHVGNRIRFRESGEIVTDYLDRESFLCLYKLVKRAKDEVIAEPKYKPQKEAKADMVNKPPHYKDASGIECKEITCHREMPFSLGNAIKYLYRAGSKGDLLEDLKKAEWYLKVAYLNGEKAPDDVVLRLHEVASVRKTEAGRALNMVALELIADAYRAVKSEIERIEGV